MQSAGEKVYAGSAKALPYNGVPLAGIGVLDCLYRRGDCRIARDKSPPRLAGSNDGLQDDGKCVTIKTVDMIGEDYA